MKFVFYFILIFLSTSCSIYRSPDRNEFEENYSQIKIENMSRLYCSDQSLKSQAQESKLIQVDTESGFLLWKHTFQIKNNQNESEKTIKYESDNTQGEFCVYEY